MKAKHYLITFFIWSKYVCYIIAQRKKKTKSRGRKKTLKDADDKNTSREVKGSKTDHPEEDKGSTQHNEVKVTEPSVTLDTRTQASLDELLLKKKAELEGTEYMPSEGYSPCLVCELRNW